MKEANGGRQLQATAQSCCRHTGPTQTHPSGPLARTFRALPEHTNVLRGFASA
jgi:hypothetical protein